MSYATTDLNERLASGKVIILDGALGTELTLRDVPMHGQAWHAAALLTHPDTIREVHEDYVRAGAQIHITNTYATSRHVLERSGLGEYTGELNRRAVTLAREAIERVNPEGESWLAGSISTFAAHTDDRIDRSELRASYTEQAELLARAGCDLIALEMMLSHQSAVDLDFSPEIVECTLAAGLPVWLGFSCKLSQDRSHLYLYDGTDPVCRASEAPDDATIFIEKLRETLSKKLSAAGPMHCDMAATDVAITVLKREWRGPMIAYPNSGRFLQRRWHYDDVTDPEDFVSAAKRWVEAGVQVIGGCCGIGPAHIAALEGQLPARLDK